MPRDGAMTFGDLIGQLEALEIACPKCDRVGRYSVRWRALERGRDFEIADWIGEMPVTAYGGTRLGLLTHAEPDGLPQPGGTGAGGRLTQTAQGRAVLEALIRK